MTDNHEDIIKFLENIPEKFDVLEVGIDFKIQEEYLNYSQSFGLGELTEEETLVLSNSLGDIKILKEDKKKALALLAHLGTILAYREIEKYNNSFDHELNQWTILAMMECKMLLESSLLDESIGFISSGLGGSGDKLRYYFLVLPSNDLPFNYLQQEIITNNFPVVCKNLNSILENIDISESYIGLTVLVPLDIAIGTVIETGINKCNDAEEFVFEHYYVTNLNIPDQEEIDYVIKVVKAD
jgi:hypothetical protein